MPETYLKVEVIQPRPTLDRWVEMVLKAMLGIAISALFVWWFFASWYPEFGFTYWQLVLPVTAIKFLFGSSGVQARMLDRDEGK